jgi:hypothetical protein
VFLVVFDFFFMSTSIKSSSHYGIAVFGVILLSKTMIAVITNYCPSFLRPPAVNTVLQLTVWQFILLTRDGANLILQMIFQAEIKELREQHKKMDHPESFVRKTSYSDLTLVRN